MKTRLLFQTVCVCSIIFSCAEAPEYTPRPQQPVTSTTSPNQSATKTPTSDAQKAAENKDVATKTPDAPAAAPTPTPTPTPSATPPNPSLGVVATGKMLIMQNCAASCHLAGGAPGTPIDARTEAMLMAAAANPSHANLSVFFTRPAAGAPATSFTHVAAYLDDVMKRQVTDPVRGPTLP